MPDFSQRNRPHRLTPVIQGGKWVIATAIFVLISVGQSLAVSLSTGEPTSETAPSSNTAIGLLIALPVFAVAVFTIGITKWAFTQYLVSENDFRLETGVLAKNVRVVPFERIQSVDVHEPFLARVFGLSELIVESAGGAKSQTIVRYLSLSDAKELRALILDRAQGEQPAAVPRTTIAEVSPERIMLATLFSLDFVMSLVFTIGATVALTATGLWWIAFTIALPAISWLLKIISDRVISDWGFTLSDGDRGLRIERGLLSRTSQTIPTDRVQGFRIEQPFIWRRFGWMRLRVDIAGYAGEKKEEKSGTDTRSTLLPLADLALVNSVMEQLVPGSAQIPETYLAAKRNIFAPIGWRYRSIGAADQTTRANSGWIMKTSDIVAHRKVQSASIQQGPLQRRWDLATVEVQTPDGPVNVIAKHLSHQDAQAFLNLQIQHARRARG